jgi:hypothetical protein
VKLACPACRAVVAPADINIAAMSAVCRACGEVFALPLGAVMAAAAVPQPPGDAERPRRVKVEDTGVGMRLWWRWWEWQYLFIGVFAVFWNGIVICWYAGVLGCFGSGGHPAPTPMLLIPIVHVAVGAWLAYSVLTAILNRTVIELDARRLTARVQPLPWWRGTCSLERERIRRIRIARKESQSSGRITVTHGLVAELEGGGRQPISRRFVDREHAAFVARLLASALRVPLIEE